MSSRRDVRAATNLVRYVREQQKAPFALPTDKQLVVERFRDEVGDTRVCLLSPFGSRVHAPLATCIGDVVGNPGRTILKKALPALFRKHDVDYCVAKVENAAGGFGITSEIAEELLSLGIHVLTSGNHVWDKKEIEPYLTKQDRLIRPANYPDGNPGFGSVVISTAGAGKAVVAPRRTTRPIRTPASRARG